MNRIEAYRLLARHLVEYACNGEHGRPESDPVYKTVTEHRDTGAAQASYSSCGDLAHWLLYRLGARESWVNREENLGWRVGRNISNLCWKPCPSAPPPTDGLRLECGDICIIFERDDSKDSHALVVLSHDGDAVTSGDYGQPGGAIRLRKLQGLRLGSRTLRYLLPLPMAITGSLSPPDWALLETLMTGEELDACAQAIGFPLAEKREPIA